MAPPSLTGNSSPPCVVMPGTIDPSRVRQRLQAFRSHLSQSRLAVITYSEDS